MFSRRGARWNRRGVGVGGGGAAATPLSILGNTGTVHVWLREDVTITSGVLVDSWNDKSGNDHHFAITGAPRPDYSAAGGPNSQPCVVFDGVAEYLDSAALNLAPPGTTPIYMRFIARQPSWEAGGRLISGIGSASPVIDQVTASPQMRQFNGSAANASGAMTVGNWFRIEALFSNSTGDYLKIGSTETTGGNAGNTDPAAGLRLCRQNGGGTIYANFEVAEVLVYTGTTPTAQQRAALDALDTARYGAGPLA